ncbi:MAG: archaemetzincin family Zn-dependent metalloprotease [Bacteroidetes bacterium]|nr:archaemetzincin family Zn-dependent metalloprotease [Bacteroidota bacterium]
MPSSIHILPLKPVVLEVLPLLVEPLVSIFEADVTIAEPEGRIVPAVLDDSRGQYNSTDILRSLLERPLPEQCKIVGVTSVDLFVPVLTYVFGEAQLDGTAAVVSTYRLDNVMYGLPADPVLFYERVLKETVHELGHTYGLVHCRDIDCAMHASTAVEDIDVKGASLCPACRRAALSAV